MTGLAFAAAAAKASAAPAGGKVLGEHTAGGPITLRDGRYGAYVSHGKVNATIPKGTALDTVTLLPNDRRVEMTWRAVFTLPRHLREVEFLQVHEKARHA